MLAQEAAYTSHAATGNCLLDMTHLFYFGSCGVAFCEPRFKSVELARGERAPSGYAMFQVTGRMNKNMLQDTLQ